MDEHHAQLLSAMPFAAVLGVELVEAGPDVVRATAPWQATHCTAGGLLHGGMLMALADVCGGLVGFLNLPEGAVGTSTIESKTNFLRGVREGTVHAEATPLHRGRTTIVVETELRGDDGRLVAKVTQTQAVLRPA
jgi:uncharacterized protein (TIGR00369 family)